jgi:hypothetical protein
VTGVLVIGAVITGSIALAKDSEFADINDGSDPGSAQEIADVGFPLAVTTDALLGAALVGAVVTTVLFFTRSDDAAPQAARGRHGVGGVAVSF